GPVEQADFAAPDDPLVEALSSDDRVKLLDHGENQLRVSMLR
ncbi:unnamed protein product, partial [Allacma fusca]